MASAFKPKSGSIENVESLHGVLTGKKIKYTLESHSMNVCGEATGKLVGGNLTLLANTIGTRSEIDTKDNILFIEDIGEYLYSIDRLLYQLKRSGKLKHLKGLLIGGFTDLKDTERPFGKKIQQIIAEAVGDVSYPVCFQFPVSHGKENLALKIGIEYKLKVTSQKTTLQEI
jgi:muramoyltetrapeptide carboxypeptidase